MAKIKVFHPQNIVVLLHKFTMDSSEKIIQRNIFEDMKQLFSRKTHVILLQFKTLPLRYPIFIIIHAIRIPPKNNPNNIGTISSAAGEAINSRAQNNKQTNEQKP